MEIQISDKKLRKSVKDGSVSGRYGAVMAKKLTLRLAALEAAESLADFWPPNGGPERCHELTGNFGGVFSMDVQQPYRLMFRPVDPEPPPEESDQRERWKLITSIEVFAIEDTHG
jgi:plasmid maintenance system killer protein